MHSSVIFFITTFTQILVLKACRLYNVFGSGATHSMHAQLMTQSACDNDGRKIGPVRGAGTRMASWFYAMIRLLHLRTTFLACINQAKFRALVLRPKERLAVFDISNTVFWKAMYTLLRAVFPALWCLRFCDGKIPAMDKVYALTHRTSIAIDKSIDALNNADMFRSDWSTEGLVDEETELFGVEEVMANR